MYLYSQLTYQRPQMTCRKRYGLALLLRSNIEVIPLELKRSARGSYRVALLRQRELKLCTDDLHVLMASETFIFKNFVINHSVICVLYYDMRTLELFECFMFIEK